MGAALGAALSSLRPDVASRHAAFIVANLAKIAAVGLVVLAWVFRTDESNAGLPVWFSLVLLAILLWFSAKQEEDRTQESDPDRESFGYDFSQGYTSLEGAGADDPERHAAPWLVGWNVVANCGGYGSSRSRPRRNAAWMRSWGDSMRQGWGTSPRKIGRCSNASVLATVSATAKGRDEVPREEDLAA